MILTSTMTGIASPDPLQHAFKVKSAPHAGRSGSKPIKVDSNLWQQWWHTSTTADKRALYIHIPFCRKRCSFCNFFENGAKPERISDYMASLCQQLTIAAQTPLAQSRPFDTVYVGGGTPTDIKAEEIAALGQAIQQFPLRKDAEITLEGRLNGFDDDKWHSALDNGFNRFSFGVQSFDTDVRRAAGRFDDKQTLLDRLQQLSQHPTASIVIDLIFGLPGQTMDIWQQDIEAAMACGAQGVDLYQLIGLGGTRIDKASEKGKVLGTQASEFQADSQTRANMYAFGANRLESKDWQRLSSCHWRRDDRERSIYNSLAKSGIEILPFGAGAGGSIHGHGMMNARDLSEWHQAQAPSKEAEVNSQLASQCLPAKVPGMILSPNPSAAFDAIFKRGLDSGILNFTALEADVVTHLHPLFEAWQQHGLAILETDSLSLTLAGRFWNVNMQTGLFEFLATNPIAEAKIAS
ncbi:heme anaerobic degradation radical SAM methyltransferase ChuW/HutW [Shewanella electrodiphila]|uniref:Heme anaerobic degradation radical SAM methyltransferase ChuW/HutW n=1 Tax=Shewanella electrodiphila TaxID=934143 RepID=A0ABT0KT77_9GAMM|nr:heme anaerobic degradation radical SAM methyltransferase ChuW/HutW [Shewanella electrodiphila]MCL1047050.1 heme anaerobic degradation radical SAM methyltransferase ChuW/HutW [Shewanella electrodiphila]